MQPGLPVPRVEAEDRARADVQGDGRLRAATADMPGIRTLHDAGAEPRIHRRPHRARQIPVHAAIGRPGRSVRARARSWSARWRKMRACATSTAICRSPIRRLASTSTATRPPPSASASTRCATTLYSAFGVRQISTIFTPADDYQVILEASDEIPERPGRARRACVSPPPTASSCRSTKWRRSGARSGRCRSTASRSSRR